MACANANGSTIGHSDVGDDFLINATTAMLFSPEAPLVPAASLRDARAVWARALPDSDGSNVLVYLHGNNNYVTVDKNGQSRLPDWTAGDPAAIAGASGKKAAPLIYELDRIASGAIGGKSPVLLVPEDAILRKGTFWANEPAGQYTDPKRLGKLTEDCTKRLRSLLRNASSGQRAVVEQGSPRRLYLCGHSGAGLPLQEAAASDVTLPLAGVPTDLWLFDCTYWSNVANFAAFCASWHTAGRLSAGKSTDSRFVCVYKPKTQTEAIADKLRGDIGIALGVSPETLVKDHAGENYATDIRPALTTNGVVFVRTSLPHDEIPTFFIPRLLETAAG